MSKLSTGEMFKILFEVSKKSFWFLIIIIVLSIIGIIFTKANRKNAKKIKLVYIIFSLSVLGIMLVIYHPSLLKLFDFIAIYFPNIAIYFAAIISMNIILWISLFNFKTTDLAKKVNISIYVIMNYILALLITVINKSKLDIFKLSSIYNNKEARALIELSSVIFVLWILFLIIYKAILIYTRKDYKPKVKKVIKLKEVKQLPENFTPVETPIMIMGKHNTKIKENEELTRSFENMLTLEDYKLLLKMLQEQKEKDKQKEEIEQEKKSLLRQKEIMIQNEEREKERQEIIRLENERREALRLEKLRLEQERKLEEEREQEKFTELEMLYRSIR